MLDASTLLKAALADGSPSSDAAAEAFSWLAGEGELVAPALLAWELGNVVHRKHPAAFGRDPAERAEAVALLLAPLDLHAPDAAALRRTGALAEEHRITFYDAAYLELAERGSDTLLVTDDGALLRAGRASLGPDRALDALGVRGRMG